MQLQINNETLDALHKVGLPEYVLSQEVSQLFGGMLQRLALARALVRKPRLLVADETYEWLDTSGRNTLEYLAKLLARDGGIVILTQSTSASPFASTYQCLFMENGTIIPAVQEGTTVSWSHIRTQSHHNQQEKILQCDAVTKAYHIRHKTTHVLPVLENVSLSGYRGEWIGIHGPNGGGKSVLCRILAGLEREDSGKVAIHGKICHVRERRGHVGYVFQFPNEQLIFPHFSDIVQEVAPSQQHDRIYAYLNSA